MSEEFFQKWINKQLIEHDVLSQGHIDKFQATLDRNITKTKAAPHLIHWALFPELGKHSELGRDGHYIDERLFPPVGDYRRMWAANDLYFYQSLCAGDEIKRISTVTDVSTKQGQSGNLIFLIITHDYQVDGQSKLIDKQTLVYRQGEAALDLSKAAKEDQQKQWQFSREIVPDSILLFRYSAITFNGHRIHYDQDYAVNVEKYPGLIVHGPLIATLLIGLTTSNFPQSEVSRFTFRMYSPAFIDQSLTLAGENDGGEIKLSAFTSDYRKVAGGIIQFKA